jgi:predicted adenine nucleotide alpha hydrolase (AANH) superfamily ATPase
MPLRLLREERGVTGYFDNPNIHPLAEYLRRRAGALAVAESAGVELLFPQTAGSEDRHPEYDSQTWCRQALDSRNAEYGRCFFCWSSRLARTARLAASLGFDAFTSSLLYSRWQKHEGIRLAGEEAAARHGVSFLYRDFRPFWRQGIEASKALGVYRQQYCGCVFSEEERHAGELKKVSGCLRAALPVSKAF